MVFRNLTNFQIHVASVLCNQHGRSLIYHSLCSNPEAGSLTQDLPGLAIIVIQAFGVCIVSNGAFQGYHAVHLSSGYPGYYQYAFITLEFQYGYRVNTIRIIAYFNLCVKRKAEA